MHEFKQRRAAPGAGGRSPVRPRDALRGSPNVDTILRLQRLAGNAAVARLAASGGPPVVQRDPTTPTIPAPIPISPPTAASVPRQLPITPAPAQATDNTDQDPEAVGAVGAGITVNPAGNQPTDVPFTVLGQIGFPRLYLIRDFRYDRRRPDHPSFWQHASWLGEFTYQISGGTDQLHNPHIFQQISMNLLKLHFKEFLLGGDLDLGAQVAATLEHPQGGVTVPSAGGGTFAQGTWGHWVLQLGANGSAGPGGFNGVTFNGVLMWQTN